MTSLMHKKIVYAPEFIDTRFPDALERKIVTGRWITQNGWETRKFSEAVQFMTEPECRNWIVMNCMEKKMVVTEHAYVW